MTDAPAPPPGRVPARVRVAVLVGLSLLFLAVGLHQAGRDAPTVDEGVDVSSGVASLVRRDLRMVPEHPALPKAVAALPALIAQPIVPETEAWEEGDWFDWSDDFISANAEAGRLDDVLRWARAAVLLQAVACGALLYALGRRFFGPDGGLVVAAAWLTTPYIVGLGHFAMIDVPFTLAVLGVSVLLARWSDHPTMGRTVALGAGLGGALATRHTALVLCLLVAAVVAWRRREVPRDAARDVGVLVAVAVAGLWVVYLGLAPGGSSAAAEANFRALVAQQSTASVPARLIGALPLPLEWRAGFAYLDLTSTPRPASLLGQSWDGGRWWFFPVSAALKLPLTLVAAVAAGWVLAVRRRAGRRSLALHVVAPALALWLVLIAQPLNLGLRLALPTVALALVGLGALAAPLRRTSPSVVAAVAVVGVVQVVASVAAVPHSLAWTPPPWTPAYRWVSDSSLDAGQALYEVRAWASERDAPYVAIDTTRGLAVEGGSRRLLDAEPAEVRGWVAVGVTPLMQTRRDELAWLRKYCPVDQLGGGSVLVYRFDEAPDATPGPTRPVSPCWGASSSTVR